MSVFSMTINNAPMNVEPIPGESLRFYVESESEPGTKHLVDLTENRGSGKCSCQSFQFQCELNLKEGKAPFSRGEPIVNLRGLISWPDATVCKHISAVHALLLKKLLSQASSRAAGKASSAKSLASPRSRTTTAPATAEPF